jgi:alpha-amylase
MTKTSVFSLVLLLLCLGLSAKKVKFSVDMTGQTISAAGVHIVGDFQSEAGLGADFAQLSPMVHESGSIYSLIVSIPAFRKYEYKFANGDLFYEVEFVPQESRVGYDNVDNRWMYVDSLKNDTSFVGAILYGANAPAGMNLVRPLVDLTAEGPVNTNGVHLAGSFQSWNTTKNRLYSFETNIYETIFYVSAGTYDYKFYNGNSISNSETVPSTCATNANRTVAVSGDVVLPVVCYSSCAACLGTSVKEQGASAEISVYPNPSTDKVTVSFKENSQSRELKLIDLTGKTVRSYTNVSDDSFSIEKNDLSSGVYFLQVSSSNAATRFHKLIFN